MKENKSKFFGIKVKNGEIVNLSKDKILAKHRGILDKLSDKIIDALKDYKCKFCSTIFNSNSEMEWKWNPESKDEIKSKVKCSKCNKVTELIIPNNFEYLK